MLGGVMPADGVFGYQFNIDFHPTRRIFQNDDPTQTWTLVHTPQRHWHTDTDRSILPLRSLVPAKTGGLVVAGKNLGVSSVVQAAVRLHGHGMLAGQAAATLAAVSISTNLEPRNIAVDRALVVELQRTLLAPRDVVTQLPRPGVILWPYQDVLPNDAEFAAVNMAAMLGLFRTDDGTPAFAGDRPATADEVTKAVARARELCAGLKWKAEPKTRRELVVALYAALDSAGFFSGAGASGPRVAGTP
ncbi:MAG: FAD-dependent oxidoreductase [Pirellulales bacterium]